MTHDEVTAAMKAEDVDAALVEKAASAMATFCSARKGVCTCSDDETITAALAAVLPGIQAQALKDAADDVSAAPHWPDNDRYTMGWEDAIGAVRSRAARLTTTTEAVRPAAVARPCCGRAPQGDQEHAQEQKRAPESEQGR